MGTAQHISTLSNFRSFLKLNLNLGLIFYNFICAFVKSLKISIHSLCKYIDIAKPVINKVNAVLGYSLNFVFKNFLGAYVIHS